MAGLVSVAATFGVAQALSVEPPPGRLAQPGDYVTLVFLVTNAVPGTVALDAVSSHGWSLLGPPTTLDLAAGTSRPVAVTVAVPPNATAGSPDRVTLTAVGGGTQGSATTRVEVAQHQDLRLVVPNQIATGSDLPVTVRNAGNVGATVTVKAMSDGQVIGQEELTLSPGKSSGLTFRVNQQNRIAITLMSGTTVLAQRFVDTVVQGPPRLSTFSLEATASASLSSDLDWSGSIGLRGDLSDRVSLNLNLTADNPLRSFAEIRGQDFGVRIGNISGDALGLPAEGGFGASAVYFPGAFAVGATSGWLPGNQFTGRLEVGYSRDAQNLRLAGALGVRAGTPTVAASMSGSFVGGTATVRGSYDGARLGATYTMTGRDETGAYNVSFSVADALTEFGRFSASGNFFSGKTSVFVLGTAALGNQAASQAQVGATTQLAALPHGALTAATAIGVPESYATVSYEPDLRAEVKPSGGIGVVYRSQDLGWGISANGRVQLGRSSSTGPGWTGSLESQARYFPGSNAIRGRLSVRGLGNLPPWTLFGSAGWDVGTGTVGLNTGTIYRMGPWTMQFSAGGTYAPASLEPWGVQLQVQGNVQFDVPVPESIVQAAGGRSLGTLAIRVEADGVPLSGVNLDIGRYRVATGADGTVSLQLPPGVTTVSIDTTNLAANLQLLGDGQVSVKIQDQSTSDVAFQLQRTAAVKGLVLLDSTGDGVADAGPSGVSATIIVEDALGQTHSTTTAKDGSYVIRGLPPGATRVYVQQTPEGSSVVGPSKRTVDLAPGTTAVARFLIQPAIARATVFGGGGLRIREVLPESDTVPPGSAPLTTIRTVGSPESVTLVVNGTRIHATRSGNDSWQARVPVSTAAKGVLDFTVHARKGPEEATRKGELVIQPGIPSLNITATGVAAQGQIVHVHVHALFGATAVVASLPGEGQVSLDETAPGRWQGQVLVPSGAPLGVTTMYIVASRQGMPDVTASTQIRVVAP